MESEKVLLSSTKEVDLEFVLSKFKLYGRFHLKLFFLLFVLFLLNGIHFVNYVFVSEDIGYRCKIAVNNSNEDFVNVSSLEVGLQRCLKPQYGSLINKSSLTCLQWEYDDKNSFVAEFNLACEDWKRTLVGSVHGFGYMIGLTIVGPLADKFGRKRAIIITSICGATAGVIKSFTWNYWMFIVLETLEAAIGDSCLPSFVLGVESCTKQYRIVFMALMLSTISLSRVLFSYIAFLIPYWRNLLLAIYIPGFVILIYVYVLDESIRWLLTKGRKKEAVIILKNAAKLNNIQGNIDDMIERLKNEDSEKKNFLPVLKNTFGSKTLLLRFLACACMWITTAFNHFMLILNSVTLQGNKYVNFGLATFAGFPASLSLLYILSRFRRKKPLIFSFIFTAAFCLGEVFTSQEQPWISRCLYTLGNFTAALSLGTIYVFTSELFPTCSRSTLHALCSSIGRIGSVVAPHTSLLARYWSPFPSVLTIVLCSISTAVAALLPDTADSVLPNTVQQAELYTGT